MYDERSGINWPLMQRELTSYFGDPRDPSFVKDYLVTIDLSEFQIPKLPRIYGNWIMADPLRRACTLIAERGLAGEVRSYDGCFNIRAMKGNAGTLSVHSWGLALDINAATNPYGRAGDISQGLVKCFAEAGFEWGGLWGTRDDMHFQTPWIKLRNDGNPLNPVIWTPPIPEIVTTPTAPVEVTPTPTEPVEITPESVVTIEAPPPPAEPWWLRALKAIFRR